MKIYADTSFLIQVYAPRVTSNTKALEFMRDSTHPILLSTWGLLELQNSIRLAIFQKRLFHGEGMTALSALDEDLQDSNIFNVISMPMLPVSVPLTAQMLSQKHTIKHGIRFGDLYHLAIASALNADLFLTFDQRQQTIATLEGFSTGF